MFELLAGAPPYREDDAEDYLRRRWWSGLTFGDLLDRAADIHPNKEAFVDRQTRLTYAQAREQAERLAIGLMDLGIKPLDRVMIQLPNWTEFVTVYFACQKIGAITVMLIDRYRQHEVQRLAEISEAVAWVVPPQYGKTDFLPIVDDVRAACPAIEHVITVRGEVDRPGFVSMERLDRRERADAGESGPAGRAGAGRPAGGPYGPDRGDHGRAQARPPNPQRIGCNVEYCSKAWDQHCEDVNLIVGSIAHDLSFGKGFIGSVITMGKLFMLDSTDAQTICEIIEREGVTSVIWVPTLAQRLLQYEDLDKYDLSSLKKMHSAGGAAFPELVREVFGRLNMRFHNGYGATEGMTCITTAEDDIETVCGTVGRPTCPGDIYKVVDLDGNTLPPGTPGRAAAQRPVRLRRLLQEPRGERQGLRQGRLLQDRRPGRHRRGRATSGSPGRLKEMINRGGESISATVIESLINRHPDVAIVAVVPMPDPLMGERVCAYIQPVAGCTLTFEVIIAFLRAEKASVQQLPERIEFVEAMPYTAAQKLNKTALKEDIARKLEAEAAARQAAGE